MKGALPRGAPRTDSIYIGSNITFQNLAPLSTYLGKPGDPEKGGLAFEEIPPPPGPSPTGRSSPSMLEYSVLHRPREAALRNRGFRLRQFGLALRGRRPTGPRGSCPDGAPGQSADRLDRRNRGAYAGAHRTVRFFSATPSRVLNGRGVPSRRRGPIISPGAARPRSRSTPDAFVPLGLCPGARAPPSAPLPRHRRELGVTVPAEEIASITSPAGLHRSRRPCPLRTGGKRP